MSPDDPRHGTPRGRYAHLRDGETLCDDCREAHNRYERRRRKSQTLYGAKWKIDATGSRRRLQALQRLGWRGQDIAELIGVHQSHVSYMTRMQSHVHATTAQKIVEVYERLSMKLGPSQKTQKRAERAGWLPPLAWDDETIDDPEFIPSRTETKEIPLHKKVDPIVVERFLDGDRTIPTTRSERVEIVAEYVRQGRSLKELERAGWQPGRYMSQEAS